MNINRNFIFVAVTLVGAAIALWSGMPAFYLLVLGCPLMMLFIMAPMSRGMGHGSQDTSKSDQASQATAGPGGLDVIPPGGTVTA